MEKDIQIKCRRGVTYTIKVSGTKGSVLRLQKMLENCCCYMCHNHNCADITYRKQQCNKECEIYTKIHFCGK